MEAGAVLGLVRTLKHDFFNHLQVISGYLQLDKSSEAKEYIRRVVDEYAGFSRIIRLGLPEAALAFLLSRDEAEKRGIEMAFEIRTDLAAPGLPGKEAGFCLESILAEAVSSAAPSRAGHRRVKVCLEEEAGFYVCSVEFLAGAGAREVEQGVRGRVGALNDSLAPYGGRAEFRLAGETGRISLYLPKR